MNKVSLFLCPLVFLTACWKPLDQELHQIPSGTLALEFASPVKYVMDLKIDGQEIPVNYSSRNRILWVEGLGPGDHTFNVHSISYVFGPEVGKFKLSQDKGAYFFIQSRKYRSSTPKNKAQVSIRAYRKQLKVDGIDAQIGVESQSNSGKVRAYFTAGK